MSQPAQSAPKLVYNSQHIAKGIENIARGIVQRHPDPDGLAIIGIHTGGDTLLRRIIAQVEQIVGRGIGIDTGLVDISFYRDDWSRLGQVPTVRATTIPFEMDDRKVLLVDDVVFTGRTIRAAMEAIFSLGRPALVELAVLVDRGHRELPIQPDYVGLRLPTQRQQSINVFLHHDHHSDYAILEDGKYVV